MLDKIKRFWLFYKIYGEVKDMNFKEWFKSKKFKGFVLGLVALVAGDHGLDLSDGVLTGITAIVSAYLIGQGVADQGKGAAEKLAKD